MGDVGMAIHIVMPDEMVIIVCGEVDVMFLYGW
jgi:hypothetical protein